MQALDGMFYQQRTLDSRYYDMPRAAICLAHLQPSVLQNVALTIVAFQGSGD